MIFPLNKILIISIITLAAQALQPCHADSQTRELYFNNISVSQGLSNNFITAIAQDKYGFIWIGTSHGLNRYDGHNFLWFNKNFSDNSIISDEITCLAPDGDGRIYIGTWNGLSVLNTETLVFENIDLGLNYRIRVLRWDSSGMLWIGTDTGLLRYDPGKMKYTFFNSQNSNLSHSLIRALYEDNQGNIWVGTFDGLNLLEKNSTRFRNYYLKGNYKPALKNNLILDIQPADSSEDSLLWIGTETGLFLFNSTRGTIIHINEENSSLSNEVIKTIYPADNGEIWLGTDFGLNIFDTESGKIQSFYHNPTQSYSLVNNVVSSIFIDRSSLIWLVTPNGISCYNRSSSHFNYLPVYYYVNGNKVGNEVKDIIAESDSIYWLATMHGVIRYSLPDHNHLVFDNTPGNPNSILLNNVNTICDDGSGRIWIGTAGGINIWNKNRKKMSALYADFEKTEGIKSNYINKFLFGNDGSFWVGTWDGGLYKAVDGFDAPENLNFKLVSDINSNMIVAGADAIWLIDMQTFYRIDLKTLDIKAIPIPGQFTEGRRIFSIYHSLRGVIWLGAQGGLYEYSISRDSFFYHQVFPGQGTGVININEDNQGNIWVSSYSEIAKLNTGRGTVELFPVNYDFPLKGFSRGCSARSPSGQLIFGGENGLLSFMPEEIKSQDYFPPVRITKLLINNKEVSPEGYSGSPSILEKCVSFTSYLDLDYKDRSLSLGFASMYFWQPSRNYYSCKLEGFDQDWIEVTGENPMKTYSNLSPGKYYFKVRNRNQLGEWSDSHAGLEFRIRPPLWASAGFIIIYIMVLGGATVAGLKYYYNHIKWKNELKLITIEKEHAEELSKSKQQLFINISKEFRTPLTLIIGSIEELLKSFILDDNGRRLASLIEKNSRRLLWLNNQFLDFRKLGSNSLETYATEKNIVPFAHGIYELFTDKATRKSIEFRFRSASEEVMVWFDPAKMETILFNLLSNAFKFTPGNGEIELQIKLNDPSADTFPEGSVSLIVSDNGIGIPYDEQDKIFETFYQSGEARKMERGSGIGLTIVKEFVRLHAGEIQLKSSPGKGSAFEVVLPLGNRHFFSSGIADPDKKVKKPETPGSKSTDLFFSDSVIQDDSIPCILLVDNNPDFINFMILSLKGTYNFLIADNTDEGAKKAIRQVPDLVIAEAAMPGDGGIGLCHILKNNQKTSHIPVILVSASTDDLLKIEGLKNGADAFLEKPFTLSLLTSQIENLIKRNKEWLEYIHKETLLNPQMQNPLSQDEKLLKSIVDYIQTNMSMEDLTIESIARHTGFGHQYIYRKVKSSTGLTLSELIRNLRIKRAAQLLKTGKFNVSEVMTETGFSNHSYFSKCFRKLYKKSPSEFLEN